MLKYIIITCILVGAVNLTDVSFYEILGVTKQASALDIRQAYKKLVIKLHPDKNPDAKNQEQFLKVTEAYETLKDPDKRHKYDIYGSYPSYSRKYDHKSQAEYDNLYYNGLYHDDPFVDTLSANSFYNYLDEGFYFINFYSPFCPPCQNVADHWKKLAEMYKGVVKIGAVNCKYYNSFCYNSMRISSYPTLIFYPNGKNGNYLYYRGERTLDALDAFVMQYLSSRVHVPVVTRIRGTERPIAYVLGENRIGSNSLTRIAFQLNGLVTLVIVNDDSLRQKLTTNDYVTVVFKYRDTSTEIEITEEQELLREISNQLPEVEVIDPGKLQAYRQKLRTGSNTPWVLYFSSKGSSRLDFHQKRLSMPDMHFGEINCEEWGELCAALQVDSRPAWAVLKAGGAYQRVEPHSIPLAAQATTLQTLSASEFNRILDDEINCDEWGELCAALQVDSRPAWAVLKAGGAYQRVEPHSIPLAAQATTLQTLSASEFNRILDDAKGVWVLLVIPYKLSWNDVLEPFTRASIHFRDSNMQFGIMSCSAQTQAHCRRVAYNEPAVLVQNGTKRTYYGERANQRELIEFIHMLEDSTDIELSEVQVLEILDVSSRAHSWLVAFLPAHCGRPCEHLARQWMKVYNKLRPLEFVRVGVLNCATDSSGFCANIRTPTARLYPLASGHHYSVNLQQLNDAPYILEWALERIDDSVHKLNWHTFTKTVIAEELNPTSAVKPWLVYFHSPRCYRCYEMYPEFAIAGILLGNAVKLGRVNCVTERSLCQHESITSYPALRLYLPRSRRRASGVVALQVAGHAAVLADVDKHLEGDGARAHSASFVAAKHDEF